MAVPPRVLIKTARQDNEFSLPFFPALELKRSLWAPFTVSLDYLAYIVSNPAMASTILAEISRPDLVGLGTPPLASITEVKHLSSYNWIEAPTPTIAVPGSPSLWAAPRAPQKLKKDSGLIYIAQNAARHPDSPLEPLFRALYIANPSFDIRSIDVVTDRNNVRKLLSFINPISTRNGLEAFTIDVEVAKNTAIFSRAETATHEFVGPHEFKGFGHEFEKAYTTNRISGSTGHHRIISYRFGDLNFIVRHETDGYVDAGTGTPSSNSKKSESDSLSTMLESLSLSSNKNPPKTISTGSKLTIREEGQVMPLESTLEIKTRVKHKPLEIQEIAPQLWVSQTFNLVRAYHYKGMFERPDVQDVAGAIKRWEEQNQRDLRKLAALISKIINVVKGLGGNASVKYDVKDDKLVVVRKFGGKNMLPKDLYSKWDDGDDSEAKTNTEHDARGESSVKKENDVGAKSAGKKANGEEKSIGSSPDGKKGKRPMEAAEEGERKLPDDLLPTSTPAKDKLSNSQDKGGENPVTDSGETLPTP